MAGGRGKCYDSAMQMPISQGRVVPETDAERVNSELERFSRTVAPEVLRALTDAIQRRRSGWVRMFVQLKDGRMVGGNCSPDLSIDLDAESG